ncbi:MAG: hypothetical protein U0166_05795 [Acidobacteriota bacterium]
MRSSSARSFRAICSTYSWYERAPTALCDNYGDRLIQIETLGHCIRYFHGLGQNFLIGVALTAVKAAAASSAARS